MEVTLGEARSKFDLLRIQNIEVEQEYAALSKVVREDASKIKEDELIR